MRPQIHCDELRPFVQKAVPVAPNVVSLPLSTKTLPCSKCGVTMVVSKNAIMVFCAACSAHMGVKK
jgi:hypothetical protein